MNLTGSTVLWTQYLLPTCYKTFLLFMLLQVSATAVGHLQGAHKFYLLAQFVCQLILRGRGSAYHCSKCNYIISVPLQAWGDPEGTRKLRFPHFMTTAQDGGKFSLTHRSALPREMHLVLVSVRGWIDPRAIVRTEGFYVNEKFPWHQLGSNQRPSDL